MTIERTSGQTSAAASQTAKGVTNFDVKVYAPIAAMGTPMQDIASQAVEAAEAAADAMLAGMNRAIENGLKLVDAYKPSEIQEMYRQRFPKTDSANEVTGDPTAATPSPTGGLTTGMSQPPSGQPKSNIPAGPRN